MADRNGRVDAAGIARQKPTEEKMDIGDDRMGPETPPWVIPDVVEKSQTPAKARDDDFRKKYPVLHEFLVLCGYGGKARKTGSLSLWAEEGKFKACVSDKEGGRIAFISSDSVAGLLEAVDRGLKSGHLDWRASNWKKK